MEVLGYGTADVRKQICIRYVLRQYNPNPVTVFRTSLGFWGVWYTNIFTWILIALCAVIRLWVVLKRQTDR